MDTHPVVFGESLFDTFPNGKRVLGGAPFNVAWHLRGFGTQPLFVTRVGADPAGREILDRMSRWGLSTRGVQVDRDHPTGNVRVILHGGQPSFDIEPDQSYDFIDAEAAAAVTEPGTGSVLYHGSLAIRSEVSWEALRRIGTRWGGIVCDINLRQPWWTRQRLEWSLRRAAWIKLNDSELETITAMPTQSPAECQMAALELKRRHPEANLIVTRGPRGVLGLFADGEEVWQDATAPKRMVDSVGAGDAFSAVLMLGILRDWERGAILRSAVAFAADVCGQQGAIAEDAAIYAHRFD